MRNCFLIVGLLFLCLISCKSNYTRIGDKNANYIPYYLKVYEADSLFIVKNYQRSYEILDSLFKKYEPVNIDGIKEFETYLTLNHLIGVENKQVDKIIKKSFLKYGSQFWIFDNDSLKKQILIKSKYKKDDLLAFSNKYKSTLNLPLRDSIELMVLQDREVRSGQFIDSEETTKLNRLNEQRIIKIYSSYGYPSYKKIGYFDYNKKETSLLAVYLHCSPEFINTFLLPHLHLAFTRGEILPDYYATVYDKLKIYQIDKQLFGTFREYKGNSSPLINSKKIDSIRRSIGLESMDYQTWRFKAKYNYEVNIN